MYWLVLLLLIPYIYILMKIFRGLLKIRPFFPPEAASTFASIIIASRNEQTKLPLLLGDISSQDYCRDLFEVIVVDDNSTDETYQIANGFNSIRRIKAVRNSGAGKKSAIKTGIGLASGKLIITVDADCRLGISWLKAIVSYYEKEKARMIICPVRLKGENGFFNRFQELEFLSLQGITAGSAVAGDPVMCNGANLSFTRESYNRHSGDLHEEISSGDDIFLLHSMKKENQKDIIWLESRDATATTCTSPSLKSFISQRARWLSKAGAYTDISTKSLAIVTLVAVLVQISTLIGGIIEPGYLALFAEAFILKSVPDFLILRNTATRYGERSLLRWFPLAQLVYPFYVLSVMAVCHSGKRFSVNFPCPKGILS